MDLDRVADKRSEELKHTNTLHRKGATGSVVNEMNINFVTNHVARYLWQRSDKGGAWPVVKFACAQVGSGRGSRAYEQFTIIFK